MLSSKLRINSVPWHTDTGVRVVSDVCDSTSVCSRIGSHGKLDFPSGNGLSFNAKNYS